MKSKKWKNTREARRGALTAISAESPVLGLEHRIARLSDLRSPTTQRDALGTQLLIEMGDCLTDRLDDIEWVKEVMIEAAKRAKATIIKTVFHKFNPIGVSGVVVIAESHLAIHIWPEHRYAAVDIFSCGTTLLGAEAASYVIQQFRSRNPLVLEMRRGLLTSATDPTTIELGSTKSCAV